MSSRVSRTAAPALTLEVPREILRGVRLHKVLGRLGHVWGRSAGDDTTFALSELVEHIDDFISHDWQTPRWKKFITLCYVYNTAQAVIASIVAASVTSILLLKFNVTALSIPNEQLNAGQMLRFRFSYIPMIVGLVTFLLFFVFWQQIRACLPGTGRRVFVDKVCISQIDPGAKTAGILGLGGFIYRSDTLVVLWSQRYLRRLWCVYEVATWLYIHTKGGTGPRQITLLPVGFIVGTLSYMMSVLIFRLCAVALTNSAITTCITVILAGAGPCLAVMTMDSDCRLVEEQVSNFSAAGAGCYCCQVNHVDPETGAPLNCDRKLVYEKLGEWFAEGVPDCCSSVALESTLEKFNYEVQTTWGPEVLQKLRSPGLIYKIGFMVGVPILWELCAKFDAFRDLDLAHGISFACFYFIYPLIVCPLILKGAFIVNTVCRTLLPTPQTRLAQLALSALVVLGIVLQMAALAVPVATIRSSLSAQIIVYALYLAVALLVFCGPWCARWWRRLVQPSAEESWSQKGTEPQQLEEPQDFRGMFVEV